METFICTKASCKHQGKPQPVSSFAKNDTKRGHKRTCRSCDCDRTRKWTEENKKKIQEARKWIPDDDPEDDLVPLSETGGHAAWSVLTREPAIRSKK